MYFVGKKKTHFKSDLFLIQTLGTILMWDCLKNLIFNLLFILYKSILSAFFEYELN